MAWSDTGKAPHDETEEAARAQIPGVTEMRVAMPNSSFKATSAKGERGCDRESSCLKRCAIYDAVCNSFYGIKMQKGKGLKRSEFKVTGIRNRFLGILNSEKQ